jgi:Tfp pilus assembly protein FimT
MTLIELVVVIALMAIIAGVSAPALASLDRPRNTSGLDAVVTLLRRSRAAAIQRGTVVTVTIDPANARYWVDPPDTATAVLILPPQATLSARSPRVHFRFTPDGQSVTDEPLFVHQGTSGTSVVLEPWTGEVRRVAR